MSVLNCPEVESLIDLHAAGECDTPTGAAVRRHLAACPGCARAHEEARQLQALLDLHHRAPAGLRRLAESLRDEDRRRSAPRLRPLWGRVAAVAAVVFLTVGLTWLLRPSGTEGPLADSPVAVVWASPDARWSGSAARPTKGGGGGQEIELSEGELWLRGGEKVRVRTRAGVVSLEKGEAFVSAGPGARVRVAVRGGKARLTTPRGIARGRAGEVLEAAPGQAPRQQVEALALRFGRHYQSVPVRGRPRIPTRPLPLDLGAVTNYRALARRLRLDPGAEARLRDNGFVVLPGSKHDLADFYRHLRGGEIPVSITADTLLHLCRGQFDETLRDLEERVFSDDLAALTEAILRSVPQAPPAGGADWREARRLALGYLAVGLRALRPEAALPKNADPAAVAEALAALQKAEGPVRLQLLGRTEDFTRDRPQGHYVRSERLKRYHAGLTWFSRAALLLQGGAGRRVSTAEARRQTLAAALLAEALARAALPDGRKASAVWERIYAVTAFYTGQTDDLGPQQYREALTRTGSTGGSLAGLAAAERLRAFELELARQTPARGLGGERARATTPAELLDRLSEDAGFRLFGRRFAPDTYALGRLVAPWVGPPTRTGQFTFGRTRDGVGVRAMPRGLDLMALLGSNRARALLHERGDDAYAAGRGAPGYPMALATLRAEFAGLDEVDSNRNLYWSWLSALKPLLAERGAGYPPFMTGAAYRTKSLDTALASWAHRRQDTALYVGPGKLDAGQMKTKALPEGFKGVPPARGKEPRGYLEPVPELYAQLLALARMARKGLTEAGVLDEAGRGRLDGLEQVLQRTLAVAEKELANQDLSADEQHFLAGLVGQLERLATVSDARRLEKFGKALKTAQAAKNVEAVATAGQRLFDEGYGALDTRSVVTVFRSAATGEVLQEATGTLDVGLFVFQRPAGELVLGAGPVLSYYEFRRPGGAALTGVEWRRRLATREPPARLPWAAEYLGGRQARR